MNIGDELKIVELDRVHHGRCLLCDELHYLDSYFFNKRIFLKRKDDCGYVGIVTEDGHCGSKIGGFYESRFEVKVKREYKVNAEIDI